MHKLTRLIVVLLLFMVLVVIRLYEEVLFYDPLVLFFKTTHTTASLPEMNLVKLVGNTTLRFLINTGISLLILRLLFKERSIVTLSVLLYGIAFIILCIMFIVLLFTSEAGSHMFLFYVRRFLIQPLFLLILIPAFYFQRKK